jgi:hypothetical protein
MAAYPLHILVNDFAIRSFRDTADRDYVHARLAYRAKLIPQFLWSSLHCLEKYAKCILLLNRIDSRGIRHEVSDALLRLERDGKFQIELSEVAAKFVERLETGAEFRYYEVPYYNHEHDLVRLDCTIWELRRYCQPIDYDTEVDGVHQNYLQSNLLRLRSKLSENSKETCITNGWLESVINDRKHPARGPLLWNNLYFGLSRRKKVRMLPYWEAGNSPLYLHPEILDEVCKYVFLPSRIENAYRQELARKSK